MMSQIVLPVGRQWTAAVFLDASGSWADSLSGRGRQIPSAMAARLHSDVFKMNCMALLGASSFSLGLGLFKSDLRELKLKTYLQSVLPKSIRILWLHRKTFPWGLFGTNMTGHHGELPLRTQWIVLAMAATSSRKINCGPPKGRGAVIFRFFRYLLRWFKKDLEICSLTKNLTVFCFVLFVFKTSWVKIRLRRLSRKRPKFIPFLEPGLLLEPREKMAAFSKICDLVMSLGKEREQGLENCRLLSWGPISVATMKFSWPQPKGGQKLVSEIKKETRVCPLIYQEVLFFPRVVLFCFKEIPATWPKKELTELWVMSLRHFKKRN